MEELDQWTESVVIDPLIDCEQEIIRGETLENTIDRVKKAIREKVLESYRNGQKAGPAKLARKEPRR